MHIRVRDAIKDRINVTLRQGKCSWGDTETTAGFVTSQQIERVLSRDTAAIVTSRANFFLRYWTPELPASRHVLSKVLYSTAC